ncbi:MAG: fold metallo-hydrolase [Proteobacteria bacterium]|nr:fold metallo-hydrolase [Pseudomonadota bacterium]
MNSPFFPRSLLPLLLAALLAWSALAAAAAPQQKNQVAGYYRMWLGKFEVTALYDGANNLETALLKNTNDREVQQLLGRIFVKGRAVPTSVNAYLINTGDRLVLIDAGAAKLFGPTLGNVVHNLRAAGYRPEQVDSVLITHLHGDHFYGLSDSEGKAVFPHAEIWSPKADNDFWLSEAVAARASPAAQPFYRMARAAAAPYLAAGQWKTFTSDQEILPGLRSIAAPGHTPGHSAYLIESDNEKLLIWGDLVHNHAIQFVRPAIAIEYDADSTTAIASRRKFLARAAREKLLVGGMHLPFPGLGHVSAEGKHYRWLPIEFLPMRE